MTGHWRGVLAMLLVTTACHRVAVESITPEASETRRGARTEWVLLWGALKTPKLSADCGAEHLHKVTTRLTPPGFLLAVITLGGIVPSRVEYVCASPAPVVDGPPPPPPGAGGSAP